MRIVIRPPGCRRWLSRFALGLLLLSGGPQEPFAQNATVLIEQAADLSTRGQPEAAYRLLAEQEDTHIGTVDFDYALGRAALAAGRPDRATLAFNRVLALQADHAGAAIDLARAYLALGNREQARALLDGLLALAPPPGIRRQLEALAAQAARPGELPSFVRGYLAATIGRDTNVNFALSQSRVFVPLFGVELDLASSNLARADRFASLGGGIDIQQAVAPGLALVGGADLLERRNAHESAFDPGSLAARFGLAAAVDGRTARVQLHQAQLSQNHRAVRRVDALGVDLRSADDQRLQWTGYAQGGRFRHPADGLRLFDADFLGAGVSMAYAAGSRATLLAGVNAGSETDRGGNPGGDRALAGVKLGVEVRLADNLALLALAGHQATNFERRDGTFQTVRRDRRDDLEFALQYSPAPKWILRSALAISRQRSSVPIYAFERAELSLNLRRNFD